MSISTTVRRVTYPGSVYAGVTVFPVPFPFQQSGHLVVRQVTAAGVSTTKNLNVDYTVIGPGSVNGGSVTLTSFVLGATETLIIERIVSPVQLTDFTNAGAVLPETAEAALDYLMDLHQQVEDVLGIYDTTKARVPKLAPQDTDGAGSYDARNNKIKNLAAGVAGADAVNKQQLTDFVGSIILSSTGAPGAFTQFTDAPPAASVTWKNVCVIVRYTGGGSSLMICLQLSNPANYDWFVIASSL